MTVLAEGLGALDLLNQQKEKIEEKPEQLPDLPIATLPIEPPSGWKFRDLKHGQLLAFYDAEPFKGDYKSIFHEANAHITAAINAKFFESPTAVTPDVLADMDWHDVQALQKAVLNRVSNAINTPKN